MRNHLRRSNLFLLRVWAEESSDAPDAEEAVRWRGKVQRVVDGESHQFSDWEGLTSLLVTMLSYSQGVRRYDNQTK